MTEISSSGLPRRASSRSAGSIADHPHAPLRDAPDDFAGATMSLTNPGGLGTVASVPRLMAGQGSIIAVGAIGYPADAARAPTRARRPVSEVVHRGRWRGAPRSDQP